MLVPEILAAGGGLLFAFDHATIAGKIVLTRSGCRIDFQLVDHDYETARDPIRSKTERAISHCISSRTDSRSVFSRKTRDFPGSPVFNVYRAGCEEMTFHLLGLG